MFYLKKNWFEDRRLITIIILAFILRLAVFDYGYLIRGEDFFFSYDDAKGYLEPAQNLLTGNGYAVRFSGTLYPETGRVPGYPVLIALSLKTSGGFIPLIFLQILLGSLIPWLAYIMIKHLFQQEKLAVSIGFILAIEPFGVFLTSLLMTETIFIFLLFTALTITLKVLGEKFSRTIILGGTAGGLLGAATLIRPVSLYIFPFLAGFLLWKLKFEKSWGWKKSGLAIITFIIAGSVFFVPWMYRNEKAYGISDLTSLSGVIPYFYFSSSIISMVENKTFAEARAQLRTNAIKYAKTANIKEIRDMRMVPFYKKETIKIIRSHPKEFILLTAFSGFHLLTHDGYLDLFQRTNLVKSPPKSSSQISLLGSGNFGKLAEIAKKFMAWPWIFFIIARLIWILLFIFAVYGTIMILIKKTMAKSSLIFILGVIAFLLLPALTVGLGVHGRLRMPANAFLLALSLVGLLSLTPKLRHAKIIPKF